MDISLVINVLLQKRPSLDELANPKLRLLLKRIVQLAQTIRNNKTNRGLKYILLLAPHPRTPIS
jgi:hypothetical protein